jgi:hypothetical protein
MQRFEWRGKGGGFKRQDADVSIASSSQAHSTAQLDVRKHFLFHMYKNEWLLPVLPR